MAIILVTVIVPLVNDQNDDNNHIIDDCCDLGYGHLSFIRNTKPSGVYVINNFCRNDHLEVEAYSDTINGGGGC